MKMTCTFKDNTTLLTDIATESCQYPDIIRSADGKMYACWQSYKNKRDSIVACELVDGKPAATTRISGNGQAFKPTLFELEGNIYLLWSEFDGGLWRLLLRCYAPHALGDTIEVSASAGAFFPRAAVLGGKAYLIWTEQQHGESRIVMCDYNGKAVGDKAEISSGNMCYRPAIAVVDGKLCCAYDCFEQGQYHIRAAVWDNGVRGNELRLSEGSEWASAPELAITSEGLTVLWYAIAPRANIDYWTAELAVSGLAVSVRHRTKLASIRDWFASVAITSNGEQDVLVHSKSYHAMVARSRAKGAQEWSNSVVVYCDEERCAGMRPRVVVTPQSDVCIIYQYANGNGHRERNADIRLFRATFAEIAQQDDGYVDSLLNDFTRPIEAEKLLEAVPEADKVAWLERNGYHGMELLFGDIHGQSDMSDGSGQIDMYYNYARTISKLDFTALTDHDCFTDVITASEWQYMKTTCNEFNNPGSLVTLLSYEWTPNEVRYDYGHKNVYFPGDEGEMFRSCEPDGLTPDRLFANVKRYGGIAIPHHPAATWGVVSAATDWDFHDPEVQRLAEIFSRHAPFEKTGTTSIYTKNNPRLDGKYIQDALARGYRIGFTAGSDSHQLEHGTEGGIVAAFVPKANRSAVFNALYDRFVYATTGARILVSLRADGIHMGGELTRPVGAELKLEVDVLGTQELASVEIICNSTDIESLPCSGCTCRTTVALPVQESACIYLRVTQKDAHQAWSSPIWIDLLT